MPWLQPPAVSAPAPAGAADAMTPVTPGAGALKNENLLMPLPPGFKVGSAGRPAPRQQMVEFVPADETVTSWTRIVTEHIVFGLANADPDTLPSSMAKMWMTSCADGRARKTVATVENGYPVSLWLFNCPLNAKTGKPESMVMKAISGADSLYDVQYAYRATESRETIVPAVEFLKQVKVCDARRADRPCPVVKAPAPK